MRARHSSGSVSATGFQANAPTVFTSTSTRPKTLHRLVHQRARLRVVGDVGAADERLAAALLDLLAQLVRARARCARQLMTTRALRSAAASASGRAQAAAAAGHEHHASAEALRLRSARAVAVLAHHLPVTRTISVVVVTPRNTFSIAASRSVRMPSSRRGLEDARARRPAAVTSARTFSVMGSTS